MTIEQHVQKAQLILGNTYPLYEREQAIYKVYMLTGRYDDFIRNLGDLAKNVVMETNLSETSDPHMHGGVFDKVQAQIYVYLIDEYHDEFVKWNHVIDGQVVTKA